MRYLVIAFMLVCGVASAEEKPWGMSEYDWGYAKGYERGCKDGKDYSEKDTLDKIYSMVFDLETKFMGVDRAEQIGMPELHARKLADKMRREPNWNGKGAL